MATMATMPSPATVATAESRGCIIGLKQRVKVMPSTVSAAGQKIA